MTSSGMGRTAALESRDQPPRALAHRSRDQVRHLRDLLRRGRSRVVAEHHAPHLLAGDVRDGVHRDALPLEPIEVLGERRPVDAWPVARLGRKSVPRRRRRALAGDVERDALPDLALRRAVGQQRHLGVRVEVDEAGRDDQARRIDRPSRRLAVERPDRGDAIAANADVRPNGRAAGAVQHLPAANDDVERRRLSRRGRADGGENDREKKQTRAKRCGHRPPPWRPILCPLAPVSYRLSAFSSQISVLSCECCSRFAPIADSR